MGFRDCERILKKVMKVNLSVFGENLCQGSGIEELMDDLGAAMAEGGADMLMLGGGQPASIPEVNKVWGKRLEQITADQQASERMLGNYEPPRGNTKFATAIAQMLKKEYGWELTEKNIAITAGGQTAFFFLFNALAGKFSDGTDKKILIPLVPEYIGYANQSVGKDIFKSYLPKIEKIGEDQFKYRVDFDAIEITDDIAAICVSRPTNPTGNVLTDNEIERLAELAEQHQIPLIVDNAYGAPFPNIFFADATPRWKENIVLTMSLSKIGLPGTRTGIVVANPEVIAAISSLTAIVGLANGNVGQAIVKPLLESGEMLKLSNDVVKPFYYKKSIHAQEWMREAFASYKTPFRMHLSEGALFLWLWFEGLPISSEELYQRLKAKGVLIVPGHYFLFGCDPSWKHGNECIRVTYTMPDHMVKEGIRRIAEEVSLAYQEL